MYNSLKPPIVIVQTTGHVNKRGVQSETHTVDVPKALPYTVYVT